MIEDFSKSMKKRLWWSILIRDRSLCIGLRRRPQVTSINMHGCHEWLTREDFEDELYHSPIYNTAAKERLLAALEEQCQLAVLLTDLVSLIFTPRMTSATSSTSTEAFGALMTTIENIKGSLMRWETQAQPPSSPNVKPENHDPAATLKNLTFMYYQCVLTSSRAANMPLTARFIVPLVLTSPNSQLSPSRNIYRERQTIIGEP